MSERLQLEIAKIVDRAAFMSNGRDDGNLPSISKKIALTKAADILALLNQAGVVVVVENGEEGNSDS